MSRRGVKTNIQPTYEKPPQGRTRMRFDLTEVEKLASIQCTIEEIAAWFGVSKATIDNRIADDPSFRDAVHRGRAKGRVSVRREQFKLLTEGNATMGIWLGKQVLGQRDVIDTNINATQNIQHSIDLKALTTDELITWQKLLDKASGDVIDVQAVEEPHTNGKIQE